MWNPNSATPVCHEEDDSWEVKAFAEDAGNVMGTTWPPRSYTCTFCRREFRSAQALGGHMNVHRRDRARLHQIQPNLNNLNLSSSNSSTLFVPTQELMTTSGLCLLYSLPNNPNALLNHSFLNNLNNGNPSINYLSDTPHSNTGNFMNYNKASGVPRSFGSSLSYSSNTEASTPTHLSLENKIEKTDSVIEGIDLELRLGCSSSAS